MFYDYIINYVYPNGTLFIVMCLVIWAILHIIIGVLSANNIIDSNKTPLRQLIVFIFWIIVFIGLIFLPDRKFIVYHYGDGRELTYEQKQQVNADLERHFEKSKALFLECLEKGQKQPHTTVFNDTNEVVKTCYDAGKYSF